VRKTFVVEARGRSFVLGRRTWIMGILNTTPDSFSDGGVYVDADAAVRRGLEMAAEGADIIDVGGESTRPGSKPVSEAEELGRVVPVVRELRARTPVFISVDTTKAAVAAACLDAGADIINDISALRFDAAMAGTVARAGAAVILMHMQGIPETMQADPCYTDIFSEIGAFLKERLAAAAAAGIPKERIVVDPGVGFGKSLEDNLALIDNLGFLGMLERPVLAGVSRKGFIGKTLGTTPGERLEGSLAAGVLCIARGAHILRVHDVRATRRAADVADAVLAGGGARRPAGSKGQEHAC
jgi:dihydropteroate synthase